MKLFKRAGPLMVIGVWLASVSISYQISLLERNSGERYEAHEVIDKTSVQLLEMRGFRAEVHYAHTADGYYIHLVHLVSPLGPPSLRPVIFNHGLLESSTIWLINAQGVRPSRLPGGKRPLCSPIPLDELVVNNRSDLINGPMMLANSGHDVWLMSMRGTDFSLRHDTFKRNQAGFWDYSLDDFALGDVPTVVDYVRHITGHPRVGYIGHSQATFSVLGLLSERPYYADRIEPVILVAPVAYFDHIISVSRPLFLGTLASTDHNENGPFPRQARQLRQRTARLCTRKSSKLACQLTEILIGGKGKKWLQGFFTHLPYYTSLKVLRHFGQLIKFKKFARYDYGPEENIERYGLAEAPEYPLERIRSKSLCLISTKSDALSHPKDVDRIRQRLTVEPFRDIFIDKNFNHFDLITDESARHLVFRPILEIFQSFERKSGVCSHLKVIPHNIKKGLASFSGGSSSSSSGSAEYKVGQF